MDGCLGASCEQYPSEESMDDPRRIGLFERSHQPRKENEAPCQIEISFKIFTQHVQQTPWSDILHSKVFYVLAYCSIMGSMMLALTFVYIPVYFKDVMMLDVKEVVI